MENHIQTEVSDKTFFPSFPIIVPQTFSVKKVCGWNIDTIELLRSNSMILAAVH